MAGHHKVADTKQAVLTLSMATEEDTAPISPVADHSLTNDLSVCHGVHSVKGHGAERQHLPANTAGERTQQPPFLKATTASTHHKLALTRL